jgi:hypothetical protein
MQVQNSSKWSFKRVASAALRGWIALAHECRSSYLNALQNFRRIAMRNICMLLAASSFMSCGCAAVFTSIGHNPSDITTRDEAHAKYGAPVAIGEVEGQSFEEFITRRKFVECDKFESLVFADILTLGLSEFILFPRELFIASRLSIVGQRLRFTYDDAGRATEILVDGCHKHWIWARWRKNP